ncbi:MAG: helix-turn-helix domain-containing protein [Polynucleobacter victoriensis]
MMVLGSKNKAQTLPEIQGKLLKAVREKKQIKPEDLAHKACLSKKHIIELEEGGISSFYSEAHKITVARKIAKLLDLDESRVLIHPDGDSIAQTSLALDVEEASLGNDSLSTQNNLPIEEKVNLENIKSGITSVAPQINVQSGKRAGNFVLVALVLVGLYVTKDNIIELIRPTPEPPKVEAVQEQVVEEVKPETSATQSTQPVQPAQAPVTPAKK